MSSLYNREQYYGIKKNKFIPALQNIRCRLSRNRAKKYLSAISKSVIKPRVLDIGCAEGRFLQAFLEYGCDCYGIEHSSYPVERFLDNDRIKYFTGSLDAAGLDKQAFDIIIMWHVLEHLDDPDKVINIISSLLKPDGVFILAVPNFKSFEAQIFKQSWFHLDVPWHKYHFSKNALNYIFKKHHLKAEQVSTFCMEQNVYCLLQSLLNFAGFKRNELYELIKGNYTFRRSGYLLIQVLIFIVLFIPCLLYSVFSAAAGKGSSLKMIVKKV